MTAVMTLPEVAAFLRVHPSTMYRLAERKQIPCFKVGRDWRFRVDALVMWVQQQEAYEVAGSTGGGKYDVGLH